MNNPHASPHPYAFSYPPGIPPPDIHAILRLIRHLEKRLADAERRIAKLERNISALQCQITAQSK
ncbi:MAG: hypothetical protein L5657_10940 [Calditerricola sp.]|jgi:hypothetical protein|nr:hypothetical protein [Calditerricola sp.]